MQLALRETRKYVGQWKHLDRWTDVGNYAVLGIATHERSEDNEPCISQGPVLTYTLRIVLCPEILALPLMEQDAKIAQALHDEFTSWGCDHEYDCCGCASTMTHNVACIARGVNGQPNIWTVEQSTTYNY